LATPKCIAAPISPALRGPIKKKVAAEKHRAWRASLLNLRNHLLGIAPTRSRLRLL
jgi:hypothetical protein